MLRKYFELPCRDFEKTRLTRTFWLSAQIVHDFSILLFSIENLYLRVFWAFEFDFEVKILKLKIADPIWWTKMQTVTKFMLDETR